MKPARFDYFEPTTLFEASAILNSLGDDAKVLAGGQTLIPAMSMRIARPSAIVDLNRIDELSFIRGTESGLEIGAMTRQRTLEKSKLVVDCAALFSRALPHIAHIQIRNRGTFGGSLVHNDPAAELPAVVAALDGVFTIAGPSGQRRLSWRQFFQGMLTTALAPNEILVSVHIPALPEGAGISFAEISRRHGDFAIVGAAAVINRAKDGLIDIARLVLFGVGDGPVRSDDAEKILIGTVGGDEFRREAAHLVVQNTDPTDDLHASAIYRREVGFVLAQRVLAEATERANVKRY